MPRYRREYVPGGTFFFTVNLLERRRRLLVDHVDDLRASFRAARYARPFEVIAIVILPDHLHCLWRLPEGDGDNAGRWARIKSGFCRRLPAVEYRSAVRIARRERGVWQRRYWEHPVRDEADLRHHADYIHFNPIKHGHAPALRDWPYSSFHPFCPTGLVAAGLGGRGIRDACLDRNRWRADAVAGEGARAPPALLMRGSCVMGIPLESPERFRACKGEPASLEGNRDGSGVRKVADACGTGSVGEIFAIVGPSSLVVGPLSAIVAARTSDGGLWTIAIAVPRVVTGFKSCARAAQTGRRGANEAVHAAPDPADMILDAARWRLSGPSMMKKASALRVEPLRRQCMQRN